jgi:cysteinyl-tRNA synthetase
MGELGIERADIEPKATESLDAIEKMVMGLIDRGYAYRLQSGDIYFDTSRDEKYGSISHMVTDEDENRSRIECVYGKRNPKDFALWKACGGDGDVCFDTSIGEGRPGWHIECSAMIEKHFVGNGRYTIDIHGGGADLLFPHHENEASQTRCATGHEIAKYWMHNGFVQIDGEKMSKSLGNSFFIKDALKNYSGEVLRFYLLSTHYRSNFNFNEEDLIASKKRLDKLYRLKKRLFGLKPAEIKTEFQEKILEALNDDMNVSVAYALIDEMIQNANEALDSGAKNKLLKKETVANLTYLQNLLGFGVQNPFEYFQFGMDNQTKQKIDKLITQRSEAKKAKDFELSDRLRDEILAFGVSIMDTAEGTFWERVD